MKLLKPLCAFSALLLVLALAYVFLSPKAVDSPTPVRGTQAVAGVLSCEHPEKDFGRIPIKDGHAIGKHKYKIRNHSPKEVIVQRVAVSCSCVRVGSLEKIPALGTAELEASMNLSSGDINSHTYQIAVVPADNTIPSLKLLISGSADFSSYLSRSKIDLPFCRYGEKKTTSLEVFLLSREKYTDIIKSVSFTNPQFEYTVVESTHEVRRADDGASYNFHKVKLAVTILPDKKFPDLGGKAEMQISLSNGEAQRIPVSWAIQPF